MPPFSGERVVGFPKPIGLQKKYFAPHGETRTLPKTLKQYLLHVPEGYEQDLWGYGLLVEVVGIIDGQPLIFSYHTSHPGMEEWGVPGAYTKNVALPLAVGVRLLMEGQQKDYGVGAPEQLLPVEPFYEGLSHRRIIVHESMQIDLEGGE